jgi:hypothetical protein
MLKGFSCKIFCLILVIIDIIYLINSKSQTKEKQIREFGDEVSIIENVVIVRQPLSKKQKEKEKNKIFKQSMREYLQQEEQKVITNKYLEYSEREARQLDGYKNFIKREIMDRSVNPGDSRPPDSFLQFNMEEGRQNHGKNHKFSFLEKLNKLSLSSGSSRPFPIKDEPTKFFNVSFDTDIKKLPLKGKVKKHPWSGSYWPMRNGMVSVRYANNEKNTIGRVDPNSGVITQQYNFKTSVNLYHQPAEYNFLMQNNRSGIEAYIEEYFSPSEKYDLLLGDYKFTLTNKLKDEGKIIAKDYGGDIPTWFGICHGWAPAAYLFDNPKRPVNVTSPNGIKFRFLPDDIKALASLFIANAYVHTNFVGDICRVFKPKKPVSDSETDLFLDPRCHAINPGTYITVLGNQVGKEGKNLVFDPDSDPEIWNQPVNAYEMRYFNLLTDDFSSDPNDVKIPLDFIRRSKDKFLNFLARQADWKTKYVVGVYVNCTYAIETQPSHTEKTLPNVNKTSTSVGAIELDENDNIIGGEWKTNSHPNFMWKYDENHPVESCCDDYTKTYNGGQINDDFKNWAIQASTKQQVLKSVINYLVNESAKNITLSFDQEFHNRWDFLFNNRR